MDEKKSPPKGFKTFIRSNSKLFIGLLLGALLMVGGVAVASKYVGISIKNQAKNQEQQSPSATVSPTATPIVGESTSTLPSTNASASNNGSASGSRTNSSSTGTTSLGTSASSPSQPSTVNYTFFGSTLTPVAMPDYPNVGYTGYGNFSGNLATSGYNNLKVSWNKSGDYQIRVQASNNGSSWSDYYSYSSNSGSVNLAITAPYYRLFAYMGNCVTGSPCNEPLFTNSYTINASGVMTK